MAERRECPVLQMSEEDRARFLYTPPAKTSLLLESFGYGFTKMWVDGLYVDQSSSVAVGVLEVTEERVRDHFGILRGVDMVEAMAQTMLLSHAFRGKIPDESKPIFQQIESAEFHFPVTKGAILNVVVEDLPSEEDGFRGYGWVLRGRSVITEGIVQGRTRPEREINIGIRRAMQLQAREVSLFGLQR